VSAVNAAEGLIGNDAIIVELRWWYQHSTTCDLQPHCADRALDLFNKLDTSLTAHEAFPSSWVDEDNDCESCRKQKGTFVEDDDEEDEPVTVGVHVASGVGQAVAAAVAPSICAPIDPPPHRNPELLGTDSLKLEVNRLASRVTSPCCQRGRDCPASAEAEDAFSRAYAEQNLRKKRRELVEATAAEQRYQPPRLTDYLDAR
jgi:hypothetical protein